MTTAATSAPWTREPKDKEQKFKNNMPLMPVSGASIAAANPWPMGPSLIELSAAVGQKSSTVAGDDAVWTPPVLCPAQISRVMTPVSLQQPTMVG